MSQPFSLRIGVYTPTVGPEYWELLSDANLRMFGMSCQDIAKVEYRQHYPGWPYVEIGVASNRHPLIGSGSAIVYFTDGTRATICDIFYQDLNLSGRPDHFNGLPHWNHERRFMYDGVWQEARRCASTVEHHQIAKSPYIDILAEGVGVSGLPQGPVRLCWNEGVLVSLP